MLKFLPQISKFLKIRKIILIIYKINIRFMLNRVKSSIKNH